MITNPNLVFHADLAKHDGSQFMSDDAQGRLCTVVGATWGNQGRLFDGNDYISVGTQTPPNAITIEAWVKWTTLPAVDTGQFFMGWMNAAGDVMTLF